MDNNEVLRQEGRDGNIGEGLLIDEFGRAYKTYYSILRAIASGKNRLVEIANLLGMKP